MGKLKEWNSKRKPYIGEVRVFSKFPFMVSMQCFLFKDEAHKQEHISRANLYQKKRGLDVVWTDF